MKIWIGIWCASRKLGFIVSLYARLALNVILASTSSIRCQRKLDPFDVVGCLMRKLRNSPAALVAFLKQFQQGVSVRLHERFDREMLFQIIKTGKHLS